MEGDAMGRPRKEQTIQNRNVRFYGDRDEDQRAWEILHSSEIKCFGSQNQFIIAAINEFYNRHVGKQEDSLLESRENEQAFIERIVAGVNDRMANCVPEIIGMAFMKMQAVPNIAVPVVESNMTQENNSTLSDNTENDLTPEQLEDNELLDFDFLGD